MKSEPIKTIKKYCPDCKKKTNCMKDKDGSIICLECLMNVPEGK